MKFFSILAKLNYRFPQPHCISFLKVSSIILMSQVNNNKLAFFYVL